MAQTVHVLRLRGDDQVPKGTSLLDAATAAGWTWPRPCGGQGRCGRCRVQVRAARSSGAATTPHHPGRVLDGWAMACQTTPAPAPPRCACRERAKRGRAPTATPSPSRSRCRWPATGSTNPAVRTFRLDMEPPSLADNTSDLARLQRELARQHGIEQMRVELPLLARLGPALRAADWKVAVTLEMRDWVYGAYLPPRLLRREPREAAGGCYGLAVDLGTTSVVAYLVDFESGRVVDTGERLQRPDRLRRRRHRRIVYSQRKRRPEAPAGPRRGHHQRAHRGDLLARQGVAPRVHPRARRRGQHDHDPPAPRHRPQVPARGALHPRTSRRRPSSPPASSGSTSTRPPACTACRPWAASWAATSPPASSRPACTPPTS